MDKTLSTSISTLNTLIENCNNKKAAPSIEEARCQFIHILHDIINAIPQADSNVVTLTLNEYLNSSTILNVFECILIVALNGKKTSSLFSEVVRYAVVRCIDLFYCQPYGNASELLHFCMKTISSRSQTCVRLTCLDILRILVQKQHLTIVEQLDEILTLVSKFSKYTNKEEMISMLHILNDLFKESALMLHSTRLNSLLPSVYKSIQKSLKTTASSEMECAAINVLIRIPNLLKFIPCSLSSEEIMNEIMNRLYDANEKLAMDISYSIAEILSQFIIRKTVGEKTEDTVINQSFSLSHAISFDSLCNWFIQELRQLTSEPSILNIAMVMIYCFDICKNDITERDVVNLINSFTTLLQDDRKPVFQVLVEKVVLEGICYHLPESFIVLIVSLIVKNIKAFSFQTEKEEVVCVTYLRLLTKILPILGETGVNEWQAQFSFLLPALASRYGSIQAVAQRCFLVLGTIDPSISIELIPSLLQALTEQIESIEQSQSSECDRITGYCKMIGRILVLHYSKGQSLSPSMISSIRAVCERLSSVYTALLLSASDPAMKFVTELTFQYLLEGVWYLQQGIIVYIEKTDGTVHAMNESLATICSVFEKIKAGSVSKESCNLCLRLLFPLLQFLFLLIKTHSTLPPMQNQKSDDPSSKFLPTALVHFQQICSFLQTLASTMPSDTQLWRNISLSLSIINELPTSLVVEGLTSYLSLALLAVLENQATCSYDSMIVVEGDESLVYKENTPSHQLYDRLATCTMEYTQASYCDYEDESFFILVNKLSQLLLSEASFQIVDPLRLVTPLQATRLANYAIQTFSLLFTLISPSNRNALIEVVLGNMKGIEHLKSTSQQILARNMCCLLWNITQMAKTRDITFETHSWVWLVRDVLVTGFSSEDQLNQYIAVQALKQLCMVTEGSFMKETLLFFEKILNEDTDIKQIAGCVFCSCSIQSFTQLQGSTLLCDDIYKMLQIEVEDDRHPLPTWSYQALCQFIHHNPFVHQPKVLQWLVQCLNTPPTQQVSHQLAWLRLFYCICEEMQRDELAPFMPDILQNTFIIEYIWDSHDDSTLHQACILLYSVLYPFCSFSSFLTLLLHHIRQSLQSAWDSLRYAAIQTLDRICADSPALLFESVGEFADLIVELLLCYQKCILSDHSQGINACSDLFMNVLHKKITSQPASVDWFWMLIRLTTAPSLGDGPLASLAVSNTPDISIGKKEWMWQTLLLSLEGSYLIIQELMPLLTPETPSLHTILSELIRFACWNTSIHYESAAIEGVQLLGLTILKELLQAFGDLPDTENPSKKYLGQFEIQVITAIRRVMTDNKSIAAMMNSLVILELLLSHHIITEVTSLEKLMSFLIPIETASPLHNQINSMKITLMAQLVYDAVSSNPTFDNSVKEIITRAAEGNRELWFHAIVNELHQTELNKPNCHFIVAASFLISPETSYDDVIFLIQRVKSCVSLFETDPSQYDLFLAVLLSLRCICSHLKEFKDDTFIEYCLSVVKTGLSMNGQSAIHSISVTLLTSLLSIIVNSPEIMSKVTYQFEKSSPFEPEIIGRNMLYNRVSPFLYSIDLPEKDLLEPEELIAEDPVEDHWEDDDDWENAFEVEVPKSPIVEKSVEIQPPIKTPLRSIVKVKPGREVHTGFSEDEDEVPQNLRQSRRRGKKGISLNAYVTEDSPSESEGASKLVPESGKDLSGGIVAEISSMDQVVPKSASKVITYPCDSSDVITHSHDSLDVNPSPSETITHSHDSSNMNPSPSETITHSHDSPNVNPSPSETITHSHDSSDMNPSPSETITHSPNVTTPPAQPNHSTLSQDCWSDDEEWEGPQHPHGNDWEDPPQSTHDDWANEEVEEESKLGAVQWSDSEEEIPLPPRRRERTSKIQTNPNEHGEDSPETTQEELVPPPSPFTYRDSIKNTLMPPASYSLQIDPSNSFTRILVNCMFLALQTPGSWSDLIPAIQAIKRIFHNHEAIEGMVCSRLVKAFTSESLHESDQEAITLLFQESLSNSTILHKSVCDEIVSSFTGMNESTLPFNLQCLTLLHALYPIHPDEVMAALTEIFMTVFSSSCLHDGNSTIHRYRMHFLPKFCQTISLLSESESDAVLGLTGLNIVLFMSMYLTEMNQKEVKNCIAFVAVFYSKSLHKPQMAELALKLIAQLLMKCEKWKDRDLLEQAEEVLYDIGKDDATGFRSLVQILLKNEQRILQKSLRNVAERKKDELKRSRRKNPKKSIEIDISKF